METPLFHHVGLRPSSPLLWVTLSGWLEQLACLALLLARDLPRPVQAIPVFEAISSCSLTVFHLAGSIVYRVPLQGQSKLAWERVVE